MPEPLSTALSFCLGYAVMYGYPRRNTAVSREAGAARSAVAEVLEFRKGSQALFGAKQGVLAELTDLAAECGQEDWDGNGAEPVNSAALQNAAEFIRALPDDFLMPEIAAEPDGSVSLDWIESRNRMFSMSVGSGDRLAYAWLDGTERGRAVVNFDGSAVPQRFFTDIEPVISYGKSALRAA